MNKWHLVWIGVDLMTTEGLRLKFVGIWTELQGKILDGELKMCIKISAVLSKKNLHLQNTNSFLSPCALLQLFFSLRSMTLTSRNHNFESKYEAEF